MVKIAKVTTTYKCDFCDRSTIDNHGCCGWQPIMSCDICDKDVCRDHREFYTEDAWSDYPRGVMSCPDCNAAVKQNWEWLEINAGRHDDIIKKTIDFVKKGVVYGDN